MTLWAPMPATELGIIESQAARPVQAALASAASFVSGAAIPLGITALTPHAHTIPVVIGATLCVLAALGAIAAQVGGAPMLTGVIRMVFWGGLAMAVTAGVGALFHVAA